MPDISPDIETKLLANDRALGLPPGFTKAQFTVESGLNGDAVSPKGARGWAQIMPATQATLEQRAGRKFDPSNIDDALTMHQAVMQENLGKFGNLPDALMAYNGGWDRSKWDNPQTSAYPYKVLGQVGGAKSDSQPAGLALAYKYGGLKPVSYQDDDIFTDGPTAKKQPAQPTSFIAGNGGKDDDIFLDLPKSAPGQRKQPAQGKPDVTLMDRVMAVPAGVNRGAASVLGLPVDTVANVLDLGKAGIGYVTSKVTGKAPPEWTEPMDRRNVVGSGDWIANNLTQATQGIGSATGTKLLSPVEPPRPDDAMSRILFSGGQMAGASVNPDPRAKIGAAQQAMSIGGGAIGGLAGGTVGEVSPEWAGVASMTPAMLAGGSAGGLKMAVRGGEEGRKAMGQRIQDLKNGGIEEPSVGLASGNRGVMGLENLLAQTPFTSGLYQDRAQQNIAGMKAKTAQLRDSISPDFGPVVAGDAIQSDLRGPFRDRINATTRALNERVAQEVGPNFYTYPENALATSQALSTPNAGAPLTSGSLLNGRIGNIASNLASDVQGTVIPPNSLTNTPIRYKSADGEIFDAPPGIPFNTLKNLRTSIGEEAASNAIVGTPEQAQFKRLYGAMSDDMRQAVNAADRQNAGVPVGPLQTADQKGAVALNRANRFYSTAMDRAEELNGIANRSTPEGAYNAVANSLHTGPTIYEKLRGTIDPTTRQKIVATIVDDLGKASPGQQGAEVDTWSPRTFLTNFAKLNENGGGEALFKRLPGGEKHAQNLKDIADAAEMVGDASKIWANPSGTAAALSARGTASALTIGAVLHPLLAAGAAAGLAGANQASKRLLLNPKFVSWLAEAPKVSPDKMQVYTQRLAKNAPFWGDKQFQSDVKNYLQSVQQGPQQGDGQGN